ncbi:hypothetical protein G3R49_08480 [Shewanella sp. WXL01]|uniref:hypothetical protein n=1 Tax=Shewanella sp. WXL01 TaxID=2709721 RepID=UPI00143862E3|nr:hypothetical protein [Shewanella sp. WXL01]NKF50605.1 hypothetical protein [Shewanella sp. WXL01]
MKRLKLWQKVLLVSLLILIGIFILLVSAAPKVSVINLSKHQVNAVVTLPSSRLDFGVIDSEQSNSIYYDVNQADGVLAYKVQFVDSKSQGVGNCGYITHSMYFEHWQIIVSGSDKLKVICTQ